MLTRRSVYNPQWLEAKGLVRTWLGGATPGQVRSKRMVQVTEKGVRAAGEFYWAIMKASSGVLWENTSFGDGSRATFVAIRPRLAATLPGLTGFAEVLCTWNTSIQAAPLSTLPNRLKS